LADEHDRGARRRGRLVGRHRQEHVVGELRLECAAATDLHSTTFAGGHRSAIGQCHSGMAAVPADHKGAGL
jgi:hypothetical protein